MARTLTRCCPRKHLLPQSPMSPSACRVSATHSLLALGCPVDLGWLLSLAGATTSIIFVATKVVLLQQKYACRDKTFVAKKLCLSRQIFFHDNIILSRQAYFCRDKRRVLSWEKTCLVATKMIQVAAPANDTPRLIIPPTALGWP